jgi:hypothetical protein
MSTKDHAAAGMYVMKNRKVKFVRARVNAKPLEYAQGARELLEDAEYLAFESARRRLGILAFLGAAMRRFLARLKTVFSKRKKQ